MVVFIEDLLNIYLCVRTFANVFLKVYFTVKKSKRKFSNIGTEQAIEQNNKLKKIDGGAIGLFDDKEAL